MCPTIRLALVTSILSLALGSLSFAETVETLAEKALARANALHSNTTRESTAKAIAAYEHAAELYRQTGNIAAEASALRSAAASMVELSRFHEGLSCYRHALRVSRGTVDADGEFAAIKGLSTTYFEMGEPAASLHTARLLHEVSAKLDNPLSRADALIQTGRAHYLFSDNSTALGDFREAIAICRSRHELPCEADALAGIGWIYSDGGELPSAIEYQKQALALWQVLENERAATRIELIVGNFYSLMGEREKALSIYQKTLRVFERIGDRQYEGWVLADLGWSYAPLEPSLAADYYRRALSIFRAIDHRAGQAAVLGDLCVFQRSQRIPAALQMCRQRQVLTKELGDPRREALAASETGLVLQELGHLTRAMENYNLALKLSQKAGDPRGEGEAMRYIGRLRAQLGQTQPALSLLRQAVEISHRGNDREGEAAALSEIAHAEVTLDNLDRARTAFEGALALMETLRNKSGSPMMRAAYFASVRQYYEGYIDVLMRLHMQFPQNGFDVLAFEASERTRARTLLEFVTPANGGLPVEENASVRDLLLSREAEIENVLRQLVTVPPRSVHRETLEARLRKLQTEIDEIIAEHRLGHNSPAPDTMVHVADLAEIQNHILDENTILLQFALGKDRSYLWAISTNAFTSYRLPPVAIIEKRAREVRKLLTSPEPRRTEDVATYLQRLGSAKRKYWSVAAQFSDMLLGPVAHRLNKARVVVSAEGILEYIPFAAIPMPGSSMQKWAAMGEQSEVVTLPSISTVAVSRQRLVHSTTQGIMIFADPVFERDDPRVVARNSSRVATRHNSDISDFGLIVRSSDLLSNRSATIPRLIGTRREAEAIVGIARNSRMALDFDANLSTATAPDLANYRILHFATHGILHTEHPELSGLVLSLVDKRGRPQEGYLRLHHVYNMQLSADLVVLSACNSALGREVRGEGMMGITRGFLFAGAKRVVSTLWKVDDEVTSKLMSLFYEGMLQEGKPASTALHDAQMAIARQERWSFPYFWAGFVLQGDWR